jgi:hypothetical protein
MARHMAHVYAVASKRNKPSIAMILVNQVRSLNPPGRYVGILEQSKALKSFSKWFADVDVWTT